MKQASREFIFHLYDLFTPILSKYILKDIVCCVCCNIWFAVRKSPQIAYYTFYRQALRTYLRVTCTLYIAYCHFPIIELMIVINIDTARARIFRLDQNKTATWKYNEKKTLEKGFFCCILRVICDSSIFVVRRDDRRLIRGMAAVITRLKRGFRALVQWIRLMEALEHTFQNTFSGGTPLPSRQFYAVPQQCTFTRNNSSMLTTFYVYGNGIALT